VLLTAVCLGASAAPKGISGMFRQINNGNYAYQSDSYRVEFDREGRMVSLRVGETEFLRPVQGETGGASFFYNNRRVPLPSTQLNSDGGLIADGSYGMFLHMEPDRLDIDVGQETPTGRVEYVFFPADGVKMEPVEHPVFLGHRNEPWQIIAKTAVRWTAPNGVSIEVHYASELQQHYNGVPAMPVIDPYKTRICGEIRFPKSSWGTAKATVNWEADKEDHNYPKGAPITLTGTVALGRNTGVKALQLTVRIEDFNTFAVVAETSVPINCTDAKPAAFTHLLRWEQPGPWRVSVMAVDGDHLIGVRDGVVVCDLDHYQAPLNRPKDFWAFWEKAIATQRELPLDAVMIKDDAASTKDYTIYTVYITGYQGRRLQGRYGEPTAPGRYPLTYGAGHSGANITAPKDEQTCNLLSYMDGMATYRTGMGNRYTSNLFYNYLDALRWVDFAATREQADMARSIYYAGSRSGPVGIAVLALDTRIRMYIANVPTNNRWDWQVTQPGAGGWGPWASDRKNGQSLDDFTRELAYFNSDNFAERVTQPVLIGFGLLDGLSQVSGNLACYARLTGKKKICFRPWWGHADGNEDWYKTSAAWRKELFAKP